MKNRKYSVLRIFIFNLIALVVVTLVALRFKACIASHLWKPTYVASPKL